MWCYMCLVTIDKLFMQPSGKWESKIQMFGSRSLLTFTEECLNILETIKLGSLFVNLPLQPLSWISCLQSVRSPTRQAEWLSLSICQNDITLLVFGMEVQNLSNIQSFPILCRCFLPINPSDQAAGVSL